jgi:hypothetical protein
MPLATILYNESKHNILASQANKVLVPRYLLLEVPASEGISKHKKKDATFSLF